MTNWYAPSSGNLFCIQKVNSVCMQRILVLKSFISIPITVNNIKKTVKNICEWKIKLHTLNSTFLFYSLWILCSHCIKWRHSGKDVTIYISSAQLSRLLWILIVMVFTKTWQVISLHLYEATIMIWNVDL